MGNSFLSKHVSGMPASATMATAAIAAEYVKNQVVHYNWGLGEPDGGMQPHLREAGQRAFAEGKTKYTPPNGILPFREAISEFFSGFGLAYKPGAIIVGNGSKGVLFNIFLATLNPGDEVIVPNPRWVSYEPMIIYVGGKMVTVEPGQDFKITPAALEAAITDKTKWFLFNNPSNPSGAVYTLEEQKALGEVFRQHPDVMILTDEMYWSFNYTDQPFVPFAVANPDLYDRVVTTNGLAKSHAMTGLRIGFAGAPNTPDGQGLVDTANKIQGNIAGNPNTVSQWVTIAAIRGDQSFLNAQRELFIDRRDAMVKGLNAAGLPCGTPDGAFYVMPNVAHLIGGRTPSGVTLVDDVAVTQFFAKEAKVIGVPGSAFGLPETIRFAYPVDRDTNIIPGAWALGEAVRKLENV